MPVCLLAAYVGTKSRLSTGMTLRFTFGVFGAQLISAMIAVDMFCWSAHQYGALCRFGRQRGEDDLDRFIWRNGVSWLGRVF